MAQTHRGPGNAPIRGFHNTEMESEMYAARGVETPSAIQLMRQIERQPADVLTLSEEDLADTVTVKCMTDALPWTHERPLREGEEALVPRKVAQRMADAMQVRVLEV